MGIKAFYDQLRNELVAWAAARPEVRIILVAGSQARQIRPADEYSDLDVSLYVLGEHEQEGNVYLQWMRDFAPIWMVLEAHHDDAKSWLILYQGAIKVDLAVVPITTLQPLINEQRLWDDLQRGYQVLLDKDGTAAQLPPPQPFAPPPYVPPTQAQFMKQVEGYFYGAVYVSKQLKRGNLWKAKWADQIQQKMLLDMLEWHTHAIHKDPVDTYYRGDFMHDWVSASTWQELHRVFAHFDAEDSWSALFAAISLFTRLTEETAVELDYGYPRQMVIDVTNYITALYHARQPTTK